MSGFNDVIPQIMLLSSSSVPDNRTSAIVTRLDNDGTVWVRFNGSTTETPCTRKSVAVKAGDNVSITVKNGRSIIDGNFTTPATDDEAAKAVEKKMDDKNDDFSGQIEKLKGVSSHFTINEDGIWISANETSLNLLIRNSGAIEVYSADKSTKYGTLGQTSKLASIDYSATTFPTALTQAQFNSLIDNVTLTQAKFNSLINNIELTQAQFDCLMASITLSRARIDKLLESTTSACDVDSFYRVSYQNVKIKCVRRGAVGQISIPGLNIKNPTDTTAFIAIAAIPDGYRPKVESYAGDLKLETDGSLWIARSKLNTTFYGGITYLLAEGV